jgi:NADP-dependent 3-hydroxy acid dehydrogenase YdfG
VASAIACKRGFIDVTTDLKEDHSAQEFAYQGCIVYATSRRVETIADFKSANIHKMALDVTSDENVQSVIQEILATEGKLDVVVNNAGRISPGDSGISRS